MLTRMWTFAVATSVLTLAVVSGAAQEGDKADRAPGKENGRPAAARTSGEVMSIQKEEISIRVREGNAQTFTVRPATKITLDGKEAKVEELRKGDRVEAVIGEGNVAQSIAATRGKKAGAVSSNASGAGDVGQVAAQETRGVEPGNDANRNRESRDRNVTPAAPAPSAGTPRAPSPDAADRRDSETREIRQSAGNGQARDDQARTNGQPRAELGVNLAPSRTIGTRIVSVDPESAAARAGIQNGDYILSINGEATNSPREVQDAIRELDAGSEIKLSIWRNGETHDMTASLGERRQAAFRGLNDNTDANAQPARNAQDSDRESQPVTPKAWLGVSLAEPQEGQEGALVRGVFPSGPAARAGFRSGDMVVGINDDDVKDAKGFVETLDGFDAGKEIEFRIMRNGEKQTLKATLADRAQFFGTSGRGGQDFRDDDIPSHSMMLEHNRRVAEQHQRLEERLDQVLQELQQIREQLGTKKKE